MDGDGRRRGEGDQQFLLFVVEAQRLVRGAHRQKTDGRAAELQADLDDGLLAPVLHLGVQLRVGLGQAVVVDLVLDDLPLAERPAKGRVALERVDGADELGPLGGMLGGEGPDQP